MTDLSLADPLIFTDSRTYHAAMSNTMRDLIQTWLSERGYASGKAKSEKNMAWMLEAAKEDSPFSFNVGQIQNDPEGLILLTVVRFSDYQLAIKALTPKQHRDLLFKMRFRLLSLDVKFNLDDDLSKITLTQHFFINEITRGQFWRAVTEMSKAMLCAEWTLDERFES